MLRSIKKFYHRVKSNIHAEMYNSSRDKHSDLAREHLHKSYVPWELSK